MVFQRVPERAGEPPELDTSVAHIARVQDYWLGGKDNFRALDIGTGIPAANNTHEVAQSVAPECRVVYADNDPAVLLHARALLSSAPGGAIAYLDADLRGPEKILTEAAKTLDFSRPVALMLVAVLQFIAGEDDPHGIVTRLLAALPPGSHLVISHPAGDINATAMADMAQRINRLMKQQVTLRGHAEVTQFFDGLDLVEPGVVAVPEWRPTTASEAAGASPMWGGVARKA